MKKIAFLLIFICIPIIVFAIEQQTIPQIQLKSHKSQINKVDDVIRLQCKGDNYKKTKYQNAVGTIFTFSIKNGQLYDREGKLVENAIITDEEIKGKLKFKNGLSWENTRFQINRYTGAFNYHTIYRTLEGGTEIRNSGLCQQVKNEKMF